MQVTEGRVRAGEASGGENLCFFQRSAQFFPLQHQPLQFLLRVGQSLGLPLSFLQADESLQRSFALSDSGFGSRHVFFDFVKPFLPACGGSGSGVLSFLPRRARQPADYRLLAVRFPACGRFARRRAWWLSPCLRQR